MLRHPIRRAAAVFILSTAAALIFALPSCARAQNVRSTADLLRQLYGLPSAPSIHITNPSVGTSPTQLLLLDPAAVEVLIVNLSVNVCDVAFDNMPSTSRGVVLTAAGGSMSVGVRDDFNLPTSEFWAVCAAAASPLYVLRVDLQP